MIIIVVNFSAFLFIFLFFIILVSQNLLSFFKKYLALSGSIGVARIFDWGGGCPNRKSHAMALSETSKQEFFVGAKIS